jgi:hypothetical protein
MNTPDDPIGYAKHCMALAQDHIPFKLDPAMRSKTWPPEFFAELRKRVEPRTPGAVAVGLWEAAQLGLQLLLHGERKAGFAESVAETFARAGFLHSALEAAKPGSLMDAFDAAMAAKKQRRAASQSAAAVSRNDDWRNAAVQCWAQHPDWTVNKVAASVASQFSTPAHLVDKSSVMRAIKPLIPKTSPSHKGE